MSLGPIAQNRRMTVMMPVGKGENGAIVQQPITLNQDAIYVCQLLAINPEDLVVR